MSKTKKVYVRLKKRKTTNIIGQGDPPKGMSLQFGKSKYFLEFGTIFRVSDKCDPENKIAEFPESGYPMIHPEFVQKNSLLFEEIEAN